MNMERGRFTTLILVSALVTEGLSACFPPKKMPINQAPPRDVPTRVSPTAINIKPYLPTATLVPATTKEIIIPTPSIEQKFVLGSFNTAITPFTFQYSESLNSLLGHVSWANTIKTADIPMPITGSVFGTEAQHKIFEDAAENNSAGNPYFVITTNQRKHVLLYFHSIQKDSAGEGAREIDTFVKKHPDQLNNILDQEVLFHTQTGLTFKGTIVNIMTLDAKFFKNMESGSPWGVYPNEDVLFARTDRFGFPDSITKDETPGTYYITIVSCQSEDGKISPFRAQNVKKRAFVTFKFQLP